MGNEVFLVRDGEGLLKDLATEERLAGLLLAAAVGGGEPDSDAVRSRGPEDTLFN